MEHMGNASTSPQLAVRRMREADLAAVAEVERVSFTSGWPPTAFERELLHNRMARYVVLEDASRGVHAFGGLWLQLDEVHVVTVAVRPEARRSGFGLVVVQALFDVAREEGMQAATLEVRVSNEAARKLYRQCGFYEVGERKRYYADNGEDAIIMTTEPFETPGFARHYARLRDTVAARFCALHSAL
jgi:ribosomal-protein-alanine N-acetyltransferase